MARRKRMQYDPPHARVGRRGRQSGIPPRPEQVFLSRRLLLARTGIIAAFATLTARLGYLQIVKGQAYSDEALENISRVDYPKATRGKIVDRLGRDLARNEQTWQVRVRPQELPEDEGERRRIFDHLVNALGLPDALVLYPRRVPAGAEATVYARAAQLLGKITLEVQTTDEAVTLADLGVARAMLRVNGEPLEAYLFEDAEARREAADRIAPGGVPASGVGWPTNPDLAQSGNVLTILLSRDRALAGTVGRAVAWLGDTTTLEDLAGTLRDTGWRKYIEQEAFHNPLVRLEDELTTDQAALCRAFRSELPGVEIINRLEYLVENGLSRETVIVKTGVSREVALKLEANQLQLPGIEVDGDIRIRRYQGGEAMSHILGYVGQVGPDDLVIDQRLSDEERARRLDERGIPFYFADSYRGQDGIEFQMEALLRGQNGRREIEAVVSDGIIRDVESNAVPPVAGSSLQLTIDLELQQAVSQILRDGIRFSNEDRQAIAAANPSRPYKQESRSGSVVALDPRSGEVLAMVSFPHYDNQLFVDGISQRKYREYTDEDGPRPLLDRALRGVYPPGSTCKMFIAAAALHEGKITPRTTFSCTGAIRLPLEYNDADGNNHPCWLKSGHTTVDVYGALEQSCDVFFYNAGTPRQALQTKPGYLHYYDVFDVGTEQMRIDSRPHEFAGLGIELMLENLRQRFWFGQATGIDLPAEQAASTLWDTHAKGEWGAGQTILASIGQGFFEVTPLQLALNSAALANGGTIYRPRLVSRVTDDVGTERESSAPDVLRQMDIRPEIFDIVKEGMRRVVHERTGTANHNLDPLQTSKWLLTNPAGEPEILIAGKTGTAERGEQDENGNYSIQHAWFTCFAPLDNPEIALAIVVEDGGEGSSYAVPVADRVLRAYFETTGRRARGKVLRPEGSAPAPDGSVLSPTAAFPVPGINAVPGAQPVD